MKSLIRSLLFKNIMYYFCINLFHWFHYSLWFFECQFLKSLLSKWYHMKVCKAEWYNHQNYWDNSVTVPCTILASIILRLHYIALQASIFFMINFRFDGRFWVFMSRFISVNDHKTFINWILNDILKNYLLIKINLLKNKIIIFIYIFFLFELINRIYN